jgi:hypothetical protein
MEWQKSGENSTDEVISGILSILSGLLDIIREMQSQSPNPEGFDIKSEMTKLREQFETMQEMFGDKLTRPKPVPGKPPDLSIIFGGLTEDKDE